MSRKPRFKPEITRVKLNPEQTVLSCNCYNTGLVWESASYLTFSEVKMTACGSGGKRRYNRRIVCDAYEPGNMGDALGFDYLAGGMYT